MVKKKIKCMLTIGSILCLLTIIALIVWQHATFTHQQCVFPAGYEINSVSVSGLTPSEALQRLHHVFDLPVILRIDNTEILATSEMAGVTYGWNQLTQALEESCTMSFNFSSFWDFLWNRSEHQFKPANLAIIIDKVRMNSYLEQEIYPRYEIAPTSGYPLLGKTEFALGSGGELVVKTGLAEKIALAFQSKDKRTVEMDTQSLPAQPPGLDQIEYLLKSNIQDFGFNGVVEVYMQRMNDGQIVHFAVKNGESVSPGIAFTAASTMKIPIMVSTLWREDLPLNETISGWLNYMIVLSENDPADRLMEQIDPVRGPLLITADMQSLGLENTFISGFFYLGAPLLSINTTEANSRLDINLKPDLYNQTTTSDIGSLLASIYDCAENGQGNLIEISNGKINREKCQLMISILSRNQIGALIEAGLPEGTQIAHKHGWSEDDDGWLHTVSDVSIVYAPEQNYVFTIFVNSSQQLLFDDANYLIARLAQTAYNGMNPNHQIGWLFSQGN